MIVKDQSTLKFRKQPGWDLGLWPSPKNHEKPGNSKGRTQTIFLLEPELGLYGG
jgi:hypothetical protein